MRFFLPWPQQEWWLQLLFLSPTPSKICFLWLGKRFRNYVQPGETAELEAATGCYNHTPRSLDHWLPSLAVSPHGLEGFVLQRAAEVLRWDCPDARLQLGATSQLVWSFHLLDILLLPWKCNGSCQVPVALLLFNKWNILGDDGTKSFLNDGVG